MKAVVLPDPGADLEGIVIANIPIPEPGPREIRLKVEAASLNPVDGKLTSDHKPEWPIRICSV